MSTRVRSRRGTHGSLSESMDHLQRQNSSSRDEIVMTPLKAKVGQILRVERVPAGVLDNRKVHYAAEGPYKGIVVNRATSVKPNKTGPETARRFIAYIQDERGAVKELREIRFWFKQEIDSGAMESHSTDFFKELISPKNFPKDHLQFVKRVLTLVQKYSVLRFIELEMRPYRPGDDTGDVVELGGGGRPPRLQHAKSAVDAPGRSRVRQATSTDDLLHGAGASHRPSRRRIRRLTVGGIEPLRGRGEGDAIPTVFVYDDEAERRKKKGRQQQQQQLQRSGGLENLNDIVRGTEDDSVFSYNGNVHPEEEIIKRSAEPLLTGTRGNPSYGDRITPIYGVVPKDRRSTDTSAANSAVFETVALTRSPKGPSRSSRGDSSAGDRASRTPSAAVEKRRSSGQTRSSASLTSPGAFVPAAAAPVRDSYTGSDVFDAGPQQQEALVNGGGGGSKRTKDPWEGSKVVAVLEDAFPTMLSVDDLGRLSRMEKDEVEAELAKLSSAGVAMEVDSGHWVRSQQLKRLNPSSFSHDNHAGVDIHRNEFRMVASAPSLAPEDQPTIAVITSLYCEKLAVDSMMDVKKTYVKYMTKGEGVVYTVGVIGRHRIVSTKLSKLGRGPETKLSAENTVRSLLATFNEIEHVLLVGVGGGVANYSDDSDHVRLGDVVVSKATDRTDQFAYFHVTESDNKNQSSSSITLETRPWPSDDLELAKVVAKMERSPKKLWRQLDAFIAEAIDDLDPTGRMTFARPPQDTDRLYRASAKSRTPVAHPEVIAGSPRDQRPRQPLVHYGAAASGKVLIRNDAVRTQFCRQQNVKIVDGGVQRVLHSLAADGDGEAEEEGARPRRPPRGFTLVRGVADYGDGTKDREWQPYAALAAAAVMKCLVTRLSSPADANELV